MPLTPEDFEGREFLVTLRGYDRDEVQAFLEEAARDYRAALKAASNAREDPFENLGREVGSVLQAAQESAAKIRAEAEAEAQAMRDQAQREIAVITENTASAAKQLREEAERYAAEIRSKADAELLDIEKGSGERLQRVKMIQSELRDHLAELEKMVAGVRGDIEAAIEAMPADPPAKGTLRSVTPAADLG